jgi:cytochrome bd-type quinol oxidase subunit 2
VPDTHGEADERADALFADALANNQRGDSYTLLTVLFAAVLFFTAMSARMDRAPSQWFLLSLAGVLGVIGVGFLLTFPKLI